MSDCQATLDDFASRQAERAARAQAELQHLKRVIIPPLRAAEIASVEIRFDGYGDSGAIEDYTFFSGSGEAVPCPEAAVDAFAQDADDLTEGEPMPLQTALETLGYLALERHHPGWENNDGGCGELVIDVAQASFVLDCSLRYTGYEDHSTGL